MTEGSTVQLTVSTDIVYSFDIMPLVVNVFSKAYLQGIPQFLAHRKFLLYDEPQM